MIYKEFKMLMVGDTVKYIGKGENYGVKGTVSKIDEKTIDVTFSKPCFAITLIDDPKTKYNIRYAREYTYKHWKFISH